MLADLLRTREAATKQVNDLYTTFLGRVIAGDSGASCWIDGIVAGAFPAEWAEQNILASDEYALRLVSPSNDGADLATAQRYRDVLGREASAGELDYWFNAEVSSDIDVVVAIASSAEYQKNSLTRS